MGCICISCHACVHETCQRCNTWFVWDLLPGRLLAGLHRHDHIRSNSPWGKATTYSSGQSRQPHCPPVHASLSCWGCCHYQGHKWRTIHCHACLLSKVFSWVFLLFSWGLYGISLESSHVHPQPKFWGTVGFPCLEGKRKNDRRYGRWKSHDRRFHSQFRCPCASPLSEILEVRACRIMAFSCTCRNQLGTTDISSPNTALYACVVALADTWPRYSNSSWYLKYRKVKPHLLVTNNTSSTKSSTLTAFILEPFCQT